MLRIASFGALLLASLTAEALAERIGETLGSDDEI